MSTPSISAAPLGFGRLFTSHMLVAEYSEKEGWGPHSVVKREAVAMDPAASVLHYGQALFDGAKAFLGRDGSLRVFRLDSHIARMQKGAARLCMPAVDAPALREGILQLLDIDRSFAPTGDGQSIYIRPILYGTEGFLGVRPSDRYTLLVILSPVGNYYEAGTKPLRLWVEREDVRAAPGGLGAAKTSANYVASLSAAQKAKARGYDQVLWLDAIERKKLEEVGTMNLWVQLGDTLVTPPLDGTILPGITRDSTLQLLRDWGVKAEERAITIDEVLGAARDGSLRGIFGTGTAAVVSVVGELGTAEGDVKIPVGQDISGRLYEAITGIQRGSVADTHGWMTTVAAR